MRKRLRKKLHQTYLTDVVCEISISSEWRKKLFQSKPFEKNIIDRFNCENIDYNFLKSKIKSLNLKYYVSVIPWEEAIGWKDWDSTQIYFKFESVEFPELLDFSANNPEVI